jgi:hypothetical protein
MGACASTSSVRVTPNPAVAIRSDAAGTTARPAEAARAAQQGGCAAPDAWGEGGNGSDDEMKGMRAEIERPSSARPSWASSRGTWPGQAHGRRGQLE